MSGEGFDYRTRPTMRRYPLDEVVSALQKAIRRGQEQEAVWWASELDRSGHHTRLWNRLFVILSEDIGPAWPEGPAVIHALYETWQRLQSRGRGSRDERLLVAHAVMLMARAPKSRRASEATIAWCTEEQWFEVPDEALDMHTARGREMGRDWRFFEDEAALLVNEADLGPNPWHEKYMASWEDQDTADRAWYRQWTQGGRKKSTRAESPENEQLWDRDEGP